MIIAGDYIESSLGAYMCLTTMAAAALGNTISDIFGLGLAHYVEQFCVFIGIEAPDLTPTQQNMAVTQRAGSIVRMKVVFSNKTFSIIQWKRFLIKKILLFKGRVVGITIGCLIGMFPLLLMSKDTKKEEKDEK